MECHIEVNQVKNDGATPLCMSTQRCHGAVARLQIVEGRAKVPQTANVGATHLLMSAQSGHEAVAAESVETCRSQLEQCHDK